MITAFHHVGISVNDIERSLAFYRDVIGFDVFRDIKLTEKDEKTRELTAKCYGMTHIERAVQVRFILLGKKEWGIMIEIFKFLVPPTGNPEPPKINDVAITHMAFEVDNLHQIYQDLMKKGVKFYSSPQSIPVEGEYESINAVYLKDPDGITLEFMQRGDMLCE